MQNLQYTISHVLAKGLGHKFLQLSYGPSLLVALYIFVAHIHHYISYLNMQ